jgi:hypothetical protein
MIKKQKQRAIKPYAIILESIFQERNLFSRCLDMNGVMRAKIPSEIIAPEHANSLAERRRQCEEPEKQRL